MNPPLTGLRVLDLSHFLAGPYATMLLADLGADVVKIEPPSGDPFRTIPPYFVEGESTYFFSVNRNKRSRVIDLKTDEGRTAFLEAVADADAVCHNFRPGVIDRLGIDFDTLRRQNPAIVVCSIYGFHDQGPWAARQAVDPVVQAWSGVMSMTGERDGPPARVGYQIGDTAAGLFAAVALLAGVHGQRSDGKARHMEVSMFDAQLSLMVSQAQEYLSHGVVPTRTGTRAATLPPAGAYECADGRWVYATPSAIPRWWRAYCDAIEQPDLAHDPEFAELSDRLRNRRRLEERVAGAFAKFAAIDLVERFLQRDVPAAVVQDLDEALAMPLVHERRMVVDVELHHGGSTRMVGNPIKHGGTDSYHVPPALDEHREGAIFVDNLIKPCND